MNFQQDLRTAKQHVCAWIRQFSDQRLAEVTAFNADGHMAFSRECRCLLGVTLAQELHRDCRESDHSPAPSHYLAAKSLDRPRPGYGLGEAEHGYYILGFGLNYKTHDEYIRRRRLNAILRAEMRRRDHLRETEIKFALVRCAK